MPGYLKPVNIIPLFIYIFVGVILYANTLHVPFIFDDSANIEATELQDESPSLEDLYKAATGGVAPRRPVSNLTFTLNTWLGGNDVTGFHLVNIFFHISTAIVLYLLLSQTLSLPANREKYGKYSSVACIATLLWLAHPLATESVTYIVQRVTSVSALFYLLSLLLYVKGRTVQYRESSAIRLPLLQFLYFSASLVSGLLAIGSKEIAVTLPIAILLYEWFFFQDLSYEWLRKKIPWLLGAAAIILFFTFLYLGKNPILTIYHSCDNREFTTGQRLLTELRVVVYYISLILFPNPDRLMLDYNFPVSTSLITPATTTWSFAFLAAFFTTALVIAKSERFLSFSIIWFFLNLVIESSVICVELVYEHRTYLPATFLISGIVAAFYRIGRNTKAVTGILLAVTLLFGYWTIERNRVWQDELVFWRDNVEKGPGKARSLTNLGKEYFKKKEFGKAEESYLKALAIHPAFPMALYDISVVYFRQGKFDLAESYASRALSIAPDYLMARYHLALIKYKQGRDNEALYDFRELQKINPDSWRINQNIGLILLRTGQAEQALPYLETAAQLKPDSAETLMLEGEALVRLNRLAKAANVFRRVLALDHNSAGAHYNLARLLSPQKELDEVLYHYRSATDIDPFYIPALYNLANLLFTKGEDQEAELLYRRIADMTPEMAGAYNNLGLLMIRQRKVREALQYFRTAVNINPGDPQARNNLSLAEQELQKEQAMKFPFVR